MAKFDKVIKVHAFDFGWTSAKVFQVRVYGEVNPEEMTLHYDLPEGHNGPVEKAATEHEIECQMMHIMGVTHEPELPF